jgi:hypothetical protein
MMFVIDQQKLFARPRVREADPAGIFAVDCPAHATSSRKIEIRQIEKMREFFSWQPENAKGHGAGPF